MNDDAVIRQKVEGQLLSERTLDGRGILVRVRHGVATLGGQVPHLADRLAAVRVALNVKGVRAVADDIEVRLMMAEERSDAEIATVAADGLRDHIGLRGCDIRPVVFCGKVLLTGEARHPEQRRLAEQFVRHLAGVKYVLNDIEVNSTAQASQGAHCVSAPETSVR